MFCRILDLRLILSQDFQILSPSLPLLADQFSSLKVEDSVRTTWYDKKNNLTRIMIIADLEEMNFICTHNNMSNYFH